VSATPIPRSVKVDRSRLPDPAATRTLAFPAIEKSMLPNGMRVWTVHHPQVPLVALTFLIRRGASSDPAGKDGLAAVTADMLDEGSGDRSAIEIHEGLARLGA
jgi:zinc protease